MLFRSKNIVYSIDNKKANIAIVCNVDNTGTAITDFIITIKVKGWNAFLVNNVIVRGDGAMTQEIADVHSYLAAKYGIQGVSQENLGAGVGYISGMPITNLSRIATGTGSSVASQSTPLHLVAYHLSNGVFTWAQIDEFVTTGHISGAPVVVSSSGWDEAPVSYGYSGVMLGAKAGEIRRFTWSQFNSDCLIKLVNFV